MADVANRIVCGKDGCEVATTGVCAEGQTPPQTCPFFGKETLEDAATDDDLQTNKELTEIDPEEISLFLREAVTVPLSPGEALDVSAVDEFLRWRPATFVAIVGDRDSGKTTLICSIYEQYLRGPFAGSAFAGSRTLIGLERQSHYARAASGLDRPDTSRTSILEGLRFLHFALAPIDQLTVRYDLMLSDRAGEIYRQARGNSIVIADLIEVAKADRTVLLLDGGRLANPEERAEAMQAVRQNLRAFLDGGALDSSAIVQVVTTKLDLLMNHPEQAEIDNLMQSFRNRLRQDFRPRLYDLTFWEIAARALSPTLKPALGVEALVHSWLHGPTRAPRSAVRRPIPLRSEFDRLLTRTTREVLP